MVIGCPSTSLTKVCQHYSYPTLATFHVIFTSDFHPKCGGYRTCEVVIFPLCQSKWKMTFWHNSGYFKPHTFHRRISIFRLYLFLGSDSNLNVDGKTHTFARPFHFLNKTLAPTAWSTSTHINCIIPLVGYVVYTLILELVTNVPSFVVLTTNALVSVADPEGGMGVPPPLKLAKIFQN